jgi:hypothetical protein
MLVMEYESFYLSKAFGFGVLFEAEGWEMHSGTENLCFREDTDTTNTVKLHFHIRVTVRIPQIGQVGTPRSVFRVTFHDNRVFIEGICEGKRCFRFLPRVEIVRLFSSQPVW